MAARKPIRKELVYCINCEWDDEYSDSCIIKNRFTLVRTRHKKMDLNEDGMCRFYKVKVIRGK